MQPIHQRPFIPATHLVHSGNVLETGATHPIDIASIEEIADIIYLATVYTETDDHSITLDIALKAIDDIQLHIDLNESAIPDSDNIRRMVEGLNYIFPDSGNLFLNTVVLFAKSSAIRTFFSEQASTAQMDALVAMLQQGKFNASITRDLGGHFSFALIEAIYNQKFGTDVEVLKKLAIFIRSIKWTDAISREHLVTSQQYLAGSISLERFGTDTEVLKELAKSIGDIEWTDLLSQSSITESIYNQKFGTDAEVLKNLIVSIATIQWTNPIAQEYLIFSINHGKFGTDPEVLKELAASIGSIKWTDTTAQNHLALAIFEQKFGTDDDILEELAASIGLIKWTEILAQRTIAAAVLEQKFGEHQNSLRELAESIGSIKWTDRRAQHYLKGVILTQKLGTDRNVLVTLALSALKIKWKDNIFNEIKVFISDIAGAYFAEADELKGAMDLIRQCHFNTTDIAKFVSEQNHVAELNSKYAHKLREPTTIQELRLFFATHSDIFEGYIEALDAFKAKFDELGLGNDQDDPDERVEERFFLYKNLLNKRFYFLNITGALTSGIAALDPTNPDFDVIFKQEFLNGISNETVSLYSLTGTEIEPFQVENKDHLRHFPVFMYEIVNRYHNMNSRSPKIKLQSLIQENMISSVAVDPRLISEAGKAELRGIAALAFSDPRISSASGNTNLKRAYDHALTMKFFGGPDDSTHLEQAFQEALTKILDFCQSCFDKETDTKNYIDVLLFSAFMFGHLSSAYVFGWHTGGADAENNSNQIFREMSLKLFKKLDDEIEAHQTLLVEGFLTQDNMDVLESIVQSIENTDRGLDTEGIGICIGQIMANISSNPGLYGHIERFFL